MKRLEQITIWMLIAQLSGVFPLIAQPILIQPGNSFGARQSIGSGVENLRVVEQSADGTEAQLTMDYSYDGFSGAIAQLLPVIGKKGQKGVSAWFGADPVTVGQGRGTITIKIRYFNDEPGVPPMFTSDQVRILILNQQGTAILTAVPFLKTIKWGSSNALPVAPSQPPLASNSTPHPASDPAVLAREAEARRAAEANARAEIKRRELARQAAEAEALARRQAEEKARAEALAREEARKKAEAETARLAQQKADADRLARERQIAEAQRAAEEKAREQARIKAEAEAARLAAEKRDAEAKALAAKQARKEAEARAAAAAKAEEQAKAELAAQKLAEERRQAEALAQKASVPAPAPVQPVQPPVISEPAPSLEIASDIKTKVTNVDVVNRSLDRSQMTFGVEFEYKDRLPHPMLGVDVFRQSEPGVSHYFQSRPAEIGKSRRNFVLFPVKFQPPAGLNDSAAFSTDKVLVYLSEKESARRHNVFPATMLLVWRAPGSHAPSQAQTSDSVTIDDFKQNDASTGYLSVKYALASGTARLHAKIFDSAKPQTATYFTTTVPEVKAGRGLQLIDVQIDPESKSPTDVIHANTVEIELVDLSGKVLAKTSRTADMIWARPK
jgi:hypothetical protein